MNTVVICAPTLRVVSGSPCAKHCLRGWIRQRVSFEKSVLQLFPSFSLNLNNNIYNTFMKFCLVVTGKKDTVLRNWTCRLIEREANTTASCNSSADKEEQQRSHEGNESSEEPPRIQKRRRLSASPTNSCQDFRSSSLPRVVFLSRSEEKVRAIPMVAIVSYMTLDFSFFSSMIVHSAVHLHTSRIP